MAPKKQLHLNFFDMTCNGSHMGIGMWKLPEDNSKDKDSLDYYIWLAKLAEKGKITGIFFADVYGLHEAFPGQVQAQLRSGANCAQMDPIVYVSAMASVTKSVSFGITGSTSYLNPFILARTYSTLDHATKGRIAWNVVTSYSNSSAKANGLEKITPHDQRYEKAHEYMDLCYALWEGSWEDGSKMFSPEKGAYDASKVHRINFLGKHHQTQAFGAAHPSPQRTPVLFQAGQSTAGKDFAAKHAEAVFVGGGKPSDTLPYVQEIRAAAAANGRDPQHIKVFPQITPILGRTLEEAQAKYEKYKACIDYEGGLAKLSGYLNMDLTQYPLDEPFKMTEGGKGPDAGIHAIINSIKKTSDAAEITPRMLGEKMAFCGFGPMPVGTPEMVADLLEEWVNEGDVDGFNVAYVSNPESYEDLVELLVPVLQKRGLMWDDYAVPGGTYRENMLRTPGQKTTPAGHPSRDFSYDKLKEKYADAEGNIVIDRRDPEPAPVEQKEEIVPKMAELKIAEAPAAVEASA
ncbi:bacterial luciferase-like protein [Coleophoma cylindrospora]|uniref:Bacterial luciferase-like protein n=1 Tax=Coleophoma cylindrospora TaxID=1849047 RepID=A0A3D8RGN9_9HELO|nr:bacterial luciferase-like protein [Coleophoma cylindrospora]